MSSSSNWDWKLNSNFSYLGVKIFPLKEKSPFYFGGGLSIKNMSGKDKCYDNAVQE